MGEPITAEQLAEWRALRDWYRRLDNNGHIFTPTFSRVMEAIAALLDEVERLRGYESEVERMYETVRSLCARSPLCLGPRMEVQP